ncbi:MAG TPA: hypothetical protein VE869_09070 [Gemmatimonas sp.]|nr:hypothetical protein [Gemmatimonas sp.]
MRLTRSTTHEHEPIGIVISDGGRGDQPSRLSAFVWGPVPDDVLLLDELPLDESQLALATR